VSAFASDLNRSPSEGIWRSLNKLVIALIVMCASVPIAYSFLPEVSKRKEQRQRIEALKIDLEHQKMQLVRFEREEKLLRNDPEYAGLIARDKLDLMKEGETIYRLDTAKLDPAKFRKNP
jgi:cell division protein FtsB